METITCKFIGQQTTASKRYCTFQDIISFESYNIPVEQISGRKLTDGETVNFSKIYNDKKKKFFLENIPKNPSLEISKFYNFEIFDIERISYDGQNSNVVTVIVDDIKIEVTGSKWQTKKLWKFDTIRCRIIGFSGMGDPILKVDDDRHPYYQVGKCYDFKIVNSKAVWNSNKNKFFNVFEVLGEDSLKYEVPEILGQFLSDPTDQIILCEVICIGTNLSLKQKKGRDPYFVNADQIIKEQSLLNKFFKSLFIERNIDENIKKLREQYNSEEAFWIFTYCNKILPVLFLDYVNRYDFKTALEINSLITVFENWIITKGILQSFPSEKRRKDSLLRAKAELLRSQLVSEILELFIINNSSFHWQEIEKKIYKLDIERIKYILEFSNFELVNQKFFILEINRFISNNALTESQLYHLKRLESVINRKKKIFYNANTFESFSLTDTHEKFSNTIHIDKYFEWSFCQVIINRRLGDIRKSNLLLGGLAQEYFYRVHDIELRELTLLNAYFILNNLDSKLIEIPFDLNEFGLSFSKKVNNPNLSLEQEKDWIYFHELSFLNQPLNVKVCKRKFNGYEISYHSLKGFLPNSFITDSDLKNSSLLEVDYTISVHCSLSNENFNSFIAKQLNAYESGYLCINNNLSNLEVGMISEGCIRRVEKFGVFVDTKFGVALLHVNNITNNVWPIKKLSQYFLTGESIVFVVLDFSGQRLEIGVKQLKGTSFEDHYLRLIKRSESFVNEDIFIIEECVEEKFPHVDTDTYVENQRIFCIEQFALLQGNLNEKISILKLVKQLYINVNNARSYLVNIFTDYFEILSLVKREIDSFSSSKWKDVQRKVVIVKDKIDQKTLKVFPDSDRLIYFLDIISLFNEQSIDAVDRLYSYVKSYSNRKDQKVLLTIAKITLSNNLMIAETDQELDFSVKNLRIIYSYIISGVFSVQETLEDKHKRETQELMMYWGNKILENEGQELEFKQSYLTLNLDPKREKLLLDLSTEPESESLKKKISELNGDIALKIIKHSALKSLAAFANTMGGVLLLGVADNGSISGLEKDYLKLKQKDRDGFGKRLDDDIKNYLGDSFSALLNKKYVRFKEGDILVIEVNKSVEVIYLLKTEKGESCEDVFIRRLSSTVLLEGKELGSYYSNRKSKN